MSEAVISVEGLVKNYRAGMRRSIVHAVRGISLTVPRGSVVAFVGPNGAGKTTTIHTVLGFSSQPTGRFGSSVKHPDQRSDDESAISLRSSIPTRSTPHTKRCGSTVDSQECLRQPSDAAIPPLLERMGLADAGKRPISSYSKGMTQRLGLAQALVHDPELLILDEPTSGLDPEGRRLVLDIIIEEKARGRTVFLSSHILSDVERTCDEVVMVRQGQVVLADRIASFGAVSQSWDIEVFGWTARTRACWRRRGDSGAAVGRGGHAALRRPRKQALLRAIVAANLDIGTVQPMRAATLEETYMKHAGVTA